MQRTDMNHDHSSPQSLKRYLKHAQACDLDCTPILAKLDIDVEKLSDDSNRIANDKLHDFLAQVIPASGDPCFGLNAARHIQASTFDLLGFIALNCANLKEAMEQVILYEQINGGNGRTKMLEFGQHVLVSWQLHNHLESVRRHMTENVLASWFGYAKDIIHLDGRPLKIWFEHDAPTENAALDIYQQVFGCEVVFNQQASGLLITREQLETLFPQANADILQALQQQASQKLLEVDRHRSLGTQVKNRLRIMLNQSIPSRELIAEQLGISSRTLQRQLNKEEKNYKDLLLEVREELAEHYLKNTTLNLADIAKKLGFSEVRSFQRSYKAWTGRPPGQNR